MKRLIDIHVMVLNVEGRAIGRMDRDIATRRRCLRSMLGAGRTKWAPIMYFGFPLCLTHQRICYSGRVRYRLFGRTHSILH